MDGGLHVSAVGALNEADRLPMLYEWPLAAPLSQFLLEPGKDGSNLAMPGMSKFVVDPESTRLLRALRERYLADRDAQPGRYTNWDGLKATDGVDAAFVYMRDATPYEDARGLLQF